MFHVKQSIRKEIKTMADYENKALQFAETYGIIDYKVKGNKMIFYEIFHTDSSLTKKIKYKIVIDLRTMTETRKALYQKRGME